jgi:hypothetical protein
MAVRTLDCCALTDRWRANIADTVGAKALDQTDHYADDRIGDPAANIVAPQGARLKRGVSVLGVFIVVGFVAFWGWNFFAAR